MSGKPPCHSLGWGQAGAALGCREPPCVPLRGPGRVAGDAWSCPGPAGGAAGMRAALSLFPAKRCDWRLSQQQRQQLGVVFLLQSPRKVVGFTRGHKALQGHRGSRSDPAEGCADGAAALPGEITCERQARFRACKSTYAEHCVETFLLPLTSAPRNNTEEVFHFCKHTCLTEGISEMLGVLATLPCSP